MNRAEAGRWLPQILFRLGGRLDECAPAGQSGAALPEEPSAGVPAPTPPRTESALPVVAADGRHLPTLNSVLTRQLTRLAAEVRRKQDLLVRTGRLAAAEAYTVDTRYAASQLCNIVAEHGWPRLDQVSHEGYLAALLITHSASLDDQRKLLPALARAVARGQAKEADLVVLLTQFAVAAGRDVSDVEGWAADAGTVLVGAPA